MSFDQTTPPPAPQGPAVPPPGAAPAPVAAPVKQKNTLGIVAFVIAVAGFLFAILPGAAIVGWLLLPVGFILGIVAICLKGKKKGLGIAAIIVAVVGTIAGFIAFSVAAVNAIDNAIDEAGGGDTAVVEEDTAADAAATEPAEEPAETGTRENPLPLGTVVANDNWEVVVNSVTLGATDAVMAENQFNEAPADGYEYILVNVTAKNLDSEAQIAAMVQVAYVTADGVTIDGTDSLAVAPEAFDSMTELYTDASVTGNIVLAVPSATAAEGTIVVTPGLLADDVFYAVQ